MDCMESLVDRENDFERIFHPQAVAVIGVSSQGNMFGNGILNALATIGFEGGIHAVNPKGGEFNGKKIYRTLEEIPEKIDFAIIAVPAEQVPATLESCRLNGVAGAEILSAGFAETGTARGRELEEEVRKISERGIRVVGPNCFGIYCPRSGLTLLPGPDLSRESGPVGFISQSGGMSIDYAHIGKWMGVRFSKVISFGNGADLRETELLEYLGNDPETKVISMYIEGVEDGRSFFRTLKKVAARKPVIINKGGLSEAGSRAVASHTASLGGSKIIWESALRQAGAIQVSDLWEMAETALAFSLLPLQDYHGISVAGGGGALGVSACDSAETYGLSLPVFDEALSEDILSVLPRPGSSARNPIDAANPFVGPDAYRHVFLKAGGDPRVDLQVLIQLLHHYKSISISLGLDSVRDITPFQDLAKVMEESREITGKPVILILPDFKQGQESMDICGMIREAREVFTGRGIPVYHDLSHGLRAVGHVSRFARKRKASA
jgi:acyl-CoA synthetase (NDP forming)